MLINGVKLLRRLINLETIIFVESNPITCFNCSTEITEFKYLKFNVYNSKSRKWIEIAATECWNCKQLFGVAGLKLKETDK